MAEQKKGSGFLGWLGRQFGYVRHAVKTDVTQPAVREFGLAAGSAVCVGVFRMLGNPILIKDSPRRILEKLALADA